MENQTDNTHIEDLAKGCLLGALCGDATGSYLEFRRSVTPEEADDALEMPGGGPFHLGSGQITDDGELALCLGQGLVDGQGVLELNKIARYYKKWVDSRPFDMGLTTRCALTQAAMAKENFAKHARKGSQRSLESQSNGALMRITPMAIWCSLLRKDHLIKSVTEETKLTHPNQVAINASIAYVYTIQHLLNNKGDYQGAYEKCKEIAKEFEGKEIAAWIEEVEKDIMPPATHQIGWLKIAFCYSLKFLRKNESYINAMREMLLQGGDTDTNCCIVGGMLGALHGYKGLPKQMVETVMKYDGKSGVPRPEFLIPGKNVDTIVEEIIKIRPKFTYIVAGETEEERKSYKKGDV